MSHLLAFDGGGIRGLASLKAYDDIMKKANWNFNHFSGSSIGAFNAAAIACGKNPVDVLNFYFSHAKKVFERDFLHMLFSVDGVHGSKYPGKGLVSVVNDFFGDITFKDIESNLHIVAYSITQREPVFFSTINEKDRDVRIADAVIASASAPIFFPPYKVNGELYIDGGVAANSPGLYTALFLQKSFGISLTSILSIGCGDFDREIKKKDLGGFGVLGWAEHLVDIIIGAPNEISDDLLEQRLDAKYCRVNGAPPSNLRREIDLIAGPHLKRLFEFGASLVQQSKQELDEYKEFREIISS